MYTVKLPCWNNIPDIHNLKKRGLFQLMLSEILVRGHLTSSTNFIAGHHGKTNLLTSWLQGSKRRGNMPEITRLRARYGACDPFNHTQSCLTNLDILQADQVDSEKQLSLL